MRIATLLKVALFFSVFALLLSQAYSQDTGIPDTVWIENVVGHFGFDGWAGIAIPFSLNIHVFNDAALRNIVIPLKVDGYSGWARFDSVSFIGSRLAETTILPERQAYSFWTDSLSLDSLVLAFSLGSGNPLPSGSGLLCQLWFRPLFGGYLAIDSLSTSPHGNLRLTPDPMGEAFTPQFQDGQIEVLCDYLIGDVRTNGDVNAQDLTGIFKGLLGCYNLDWDDPWHADVNCDRRTDLLDCIILSDCVLLDSLDILCQCGAFVPAQYNDPGNPDTLWISDDTLYVGDTNRVVINLSNDEPLRGFALALEWNGSATLNLLEGSQPKAERLIGLDLDLLNYMCRAANGFNPDTFFTATWGSYYDLLEPGSGPIVNAFYVPLSPGTASFRAVSYYTRSPLRMGGQTMLVTADNSPILPVVVGTLTVLAYMCGDPSGDRTVNIQDITFLINYLYKSGIAPSPVESGDINNDGTPNIQDITYLINFLYRSGPPPDC